MSRNHESHGAAYRIFATQDYYALFDSPLSSIKSVKECHYVFSLLATYPFLLVVISWGQTR